MSFAGFPAETTDFLADLRENNTRDWFDANKKRYNKVLMDPAKAFVSSIGEPLPALGENLHAEPRVNGSIFRINRDTRFSKDKTPYKTHLDMMFWQGEGRSRDCPGYFFRLTPDRLHLGAGIHGFAPDKLATFRSAVAAETGAQLETAIAEVSGAGPYELGGSHYKRVPKGFAADHPRADLLKHNALHVFAELDHPAELGTAAVVDVVISHFAALSPVQTWLYDNVFA